jgi:alpha-mannosidase
MKSKQKYWIVGVNHVDLAWKRTRPEMEELVEIYFTRLLDSLEHNPAYKNIIEQAAHLRVFAENRPDLFKKMKHFVQEGRLEFVGGMASTMEVNVPNGESFIRNQLLGLKWAREKFGVDIQTGWLIDTFGVHAQIPQLLNNFGIRWLIADRFGGTVYEDVFTARGLDGSEILVIGRDVYSAYQKPGHIFFKFTKNWEEIDQLFEAAAAAKGDGPFMVIPYIENEYTLSHRPEYHIHKGKPGEWGYGLPRDFFPALEAGGEKFPVLHADLNPEFTATFSQRIEIRLINRRVENFLLEAEKWALIAGLNGWRDEISEAWWNMAFLQFHDVFTGSHPTKIYNHVIDQYQKLEKFALELLQQSIGGGPFDSAGSSITYQLINGLPFNRDTVISIPYPGKVDSVRLGSLDIPCASVFGELLVRVQIPAGSQQTIEIQPGSSTDFSDKKVERAVIENEHLFLEVSQGLGIQRLTLKQTGRTVLENVGDFLVIQRDQGSFQIESPISAEITAAAGEFEIYQSKTSEVGQHLFLRGSFPGLLWNEQKPPLDWEIEFNLFNADPVLYATIRLDWHGEEARLRLKLPTCIRSHEGIYEIPFGVVNRKPYGIRGNARGEWPAARFVVLEDTEGGLALINTGTPGVEVMGGTLWNSLLRAPRAEYAGMVTDETSSQHGRHTFHFGILPYHGRWEQSRLLQAAQEMNNPILAIPGGSKNNTNFLGQIYFELKPSNLILSTLKAPEDRSEEWIARLYETTGAPTHGELFIKGAVKAWRSSLAEERLEEIPCQKGWIDLTLSAFEILTLRIQVSSARLV